MSSSIITTALAGSGVRFHKWTEQGQVLRGRIVEVEAEQERVFGSTDLAYWPDGKPRNRAVITLQTDEATDPQDDGMRRLAVPLYGKHLDRLRKATKTAGVTDLKPGQWFAARWSSGVGGAHDPRIIEYHVTAAPSPVAESLNLEEPTDADLGLLPEGVTFEQMEQARKLLATGTAAELVAATVGVPVELLANEPGF